MKTKIRKIWRSTNLELGGFFALIGRDGANTMAHNEVALTYVFCMVVDDDAEGGLGELGRGP